MQTTHQTVVNINKLQITSNTGGGAVDISAVVPEFSYYESVLSNVITASMVVTETGFEAKKNETIDPESLMVFQSGVVRESILN